MKYKAKKTHPHNLGRLTDEEYDRLWLIKEPEKINTKNQSKENRKNEENNQRNSKGIQSV